MASVKNGKSRWRTGWMFMMAALALVAAIDEAGCQSEVAVESVGSSTTQSQALVSDSKGDPARTGVYYDDLNLLTPANIDAGLFVEAPTRYQVTGPIYAQPLVVPSVPLPSGNVDLLLVATTQNHLYGFDARKPGSSPLWQIDDSDAGFGAAPNIGMNPFNTGPPEAGIDNNPIDCANIGNIGILSTPAVDTTTNRAYVVSATGPGGSHSFNLQVIDITAGSIAKTFPIYPLAVAGYDGGLISFDPGKHIQRPALALVKKNGKTYVIAAFSSSCDAPNPFYGWVLAFDVTIPTAPVLTGEFNDSRNASQTPQGGIWMSGAGPAIDPQGNIYLLSGNGDGYDAGAVFSNSAIKLSIDANGQFVQPGSDTTTYFTPSDWHDLQACDLDLGVSGITYIADNTEPMLLFGSKRGKAYLLNANSLGGTSPLDVKQLACPQIAVQAPVGTYCSSISQPSLRNCEAPGTQQPPTYTQNGVFCPLGSPTDGGVGSSDGGPGNWPTSGCPAGQQVWPHIHGSPIFWANGPDAVFLGGQYDYVRRVDVDRANHVFKDLTSNTYYAPDIAPNEGYGAIMSLADTLVGGVHKGVLFANMQAPRGTPKAPFAWWPKHSLAELAMGALYAVDATPSGSTMQLLFDSSKSQPWILAKFTPPTIYRGSVYLATMSDELIVFGVDSDGDKVPDGLDNCPTVANADQRNTNEDVERVQSQPLLGDACDPNATTALVNNSTVYDNSLNGTCYNVLLSPNSMTIQGFACGLAMSSGFALTGYIGNDAGTAPQTNGTMGPAFCPCANATTNEVLRQNCFVAKANGGSGCLPARDDLFPPLDGGAPPQNPVTSWKTITQAVNGGFQQFAAQTITHSQPKFAGVSATPGWDFFRDLQSFTGDASAPVGTSLEGLAWSNVMTFNPVANSGELARDTNLSLNNSYPAIHAEVKAPHFISSSVPINYNPVPWWLWGISPVDPEWLVPISGVGILAAQQGGMVPTTSRFTAGAQSLMAPINAPGSTTFLVVNDGAHVGVQNIVGVVVTTSSSSIQLNGALLRSGYQVDALGTSGGASAPTVANWVAYAMDSERGLFYVLTRDPGSGAQGVQQFNIRQGLHGVAASTHALSGGTFATPLALQFNNAKGALFLLDRLDSGGNSSLRLLSIADDGTTQVLWSTLAVPSASFPTQSFLTVDGSGEVTVSLTVPGGASAEVMTMDSMGAPTRSFDSTIGISTRVNTEPSGSFWAVGKTYQPGTSYWSLTPTRTDVSQLLPTICGATWLRTVAGSSGLLASAAASCSVITNGGFETGDFQGWTTTGASETLSTSAHTGKYAAELGLSTPTNGDSTVKETITVPPGGGTLSFWYSIACPDTVQYDWFTASLQTPQGATLATVVSNTCVGSSGWVHVTYNLASYANQTVVVVLTNHDDNYSTDPTYTFVDDVSVQ